MRDFILGGSKIIADGSAAMKLKDPCPWKKSYDQPRQSIKKQSRYFANEGLSSQSYFCFQESCMDVKVGP